MFCGKCGFKLGETDARCPRCGWRRPSFSQPPAADLDETQPVVLNDAPTLKPERQIDAPANYDYDEPSRQDFSSEEYFPPVPNFYNQPQGYYSEDELIPEAYRKPKAAAPKRKMSRKPMVIAIAVICAALLALGGFITWQLVYKNSDGYKISRAEELILSGDYQTGLGEISELKTQEAEDIRRFTELLLKKESFAAHYNAEQLQAAESDAGTSAAALRESLSGMVNLQLPDKLAEKYKLYRKRADGMSECLDRLTHADLTDAQKCVLDFKKRKEGATFTPDELQGIVNVSEPAVKSIENRMIDHEAFKELTAASKAQAVATANEFYQTVLAQVAQDKFDLDTYRKSYSGTTPIKLSDTVASYDAAVGTGLKSLNSTSDAEQNAWTVVDSLMIAWTAYAFEVD